MKILLDMNLSPEWINFFSENLIECVHWSYIGDAKAKDSEIFNFARNNDFVIFTHDLDFSALLAHSNSCGPSVIQIRAQNITPENCGITILTVLKDNINFLEQGAILIIEEFNHRVRILPLKNKT